MTSSALVAQSAQPAALTDYAMRPQALLAQAHLIQEVMKEAMQYGEHYGVIPGTEKKDKEGKILPPEQQKRTLLKSGAEKLCFVFGLSNKLDITSVDLANGHREFTIVCNLFDRNGNARGQGVGFASTMESKHRYRGSAAKKCPKCGASAIRRSATEYGGGWYCDTKKDGCNAKYKPDSAEGIAFGKELSARAENQDPADQFNTVLKMAKKRALVDAVLTATAASDIFSQDMDDLEDKMERLDEAEQVVITDAKVREDKSEKTGKEEKKAEKKEAKSSEKAEPTPRMVMTAVGRHLWNDCNAKLNDSGTAIIDRLCAVHGATSIPTVPDALVPQVTKDIEHLRKSLAAAGMESLENDLGAWEKIAAESK
jgi:ribosomal protein L37AE/L43A